DPNALTVLAPDKLPSQTPPPPFAPRAISGPQPPAPSGAPGQAQAQAKAPSGKSAPAPSGKSAPAPSGKSAPAPSASPPPTMTGTALPTAEDLDRIEQAARLDEAVVEAPPDSTPATRTNVPRAKKSSGPNAPAPSPSPSPSPPSLTPQT